MNVFPGRLALQQRVIPSYRAHFFDRLAESCSGGLSLFAGQPLPVESIPTTSEFQNASYTQAANYHFRDPQSPAYFCWQGGLRDWLSSQDPDALILEANPRYLAAAGAVRWMKARGRPAVGWGLGMPRGGSRIERYLRLQFLGSLDGVIAYSQRGADEYRALGLPRVTVAYNAVSPRPDTQPPERPISPDRPPSILFVGRLQARKRIDILLHACAALPPNLQPRLVVVGDGPAKETFEAQAAAIYPQAEFTGAKHDAELDPYFAAADLFALPGTGGLAVQQAMTHGLPVVVAQGDGTQDDLVRPGNGWQVPPGDQDAFNHALQQALSNFSRLRRMGAESYRIVSEEINVEAMVAAFVMALGGAK